MKLFETMLLLATLSPTASAAEHVIPAPRIDGSSDEAFDRSHARLVQSLLPEDRLRLTLAEGIVLAPLGCLTDSALRSCRVALDGMGFQDIMARAYPAGSSAGIDALRQLVGKDNFAADGALYTGVQDPVVRAELNARFDRALDLLIAAAHDGAETSDYLAIIDQQINSFDRYALDTEERRAGRIELREGDGLSRDREFGWDSQHVDVWGGCSFSFTVRAEVSW